MEVAHNLRARRDCAVREGIEVIKVQNVRRTSLKLRQQHVAKALVTMASIHDVGFPPHGGCQRPPNLHERRCLLEWRGSNSDTGVAKRFQRHTSRRSRH